MNLFGLSGLTPEAYNELLPIQWPVKADGKGTPRLFVDGRFQTPPMVVPAWSRSSRAGPAEATGEAFPMSLNTGRIRDQWHTMTRTGLAPDLCAAMRPRPYVGDPSGRRRGPGPEGWGPGAGDDVARRGRSRGQGQRPPAARLAVRADALD
ncbi:hypothetical protein ACRAWD_15445 [Caulobacter segnis]